MACGAKQVPGRAFRASGRCPVQGDGRVEINGVGPPRVTELEGAGRLVMESESLRRRDGGVDGLPEPVVNEPERVGPCSFEDLPPAQRLETVKDRLLIPEHAGKQF